MLIIVGLLVFCHYPTIKESTIQKVYVYSSTNNTMHSVSPQNFRKSVKSVRLLHTKTKIIASSPRFFETGTLHPKKVAIPHAKNAAPSTDDALLKILHNAITAHQQYPENAINLQQTGRVKMGLMLYPNGHISEISILESSGIESLDNAAVAAVKSITRLPNVATYLQTAKFFSVDIVFSL